MIPLKNNEKKILKIDLTEKFKSIFFFGRKIQIYTYIKSSLGPKEPIIWEISLAITTISLPLGYSGVFKSNFQATYGEKMRDLTVTIFFYVKLIIFI